MEVKVRLTSIGQGPTEDKVKPMKKGFFPMEVQQFPVVSRAQSSHSSQLSDQFPSKETFAVIRTGRVSLAMFIIIPPA
jgi:hypothetical protein